MFAGVTGADTARCSNQLPLQLQLQGQHVSSTRIQRGIQHLAWRADQGDLFLRYAYAFASAFGALESGDAALVPITYDT
jgi:hypothetical protein